MYWAYKFYHDGRSPPYIPGQYMVIGCDYNNLFEDDPWFKIDWVKVYEAEKRLRS